MARNLILYIASSLDGFIAKPGDDLSFLNPMQSEGEDYGYGEFITGVDTVILGRRTYEWVTNQGFAFPHADKESYVITRTPRPSIGRLHFYTGDLAYLVRELKSKPGRHIFCDGGAQIVNLLLKEKLIDEIYLSIVPALLGNGIRLFQDERPEQWMKLKGAKTFQTGLVQLHYVMND